MGVALGGGAAVEQVPATASCRGPECAWTSCDRGQGGLCPLVSGGLKAQRKGRQWYRSLAGAARALVLAASEGKGFPWEAHLGRREKGESAGSRLLHCRDRSSWG